MKLRVSVLLLWIVGFSVGAENAYQISGKVLIDEKGKLYIHLVDEEQFSIPFTGIREIIVSLSFEHMNAGSVEFAFQDIPSGCYGLRVFIDTSGNGELDRGLFGPSEPWGMSWQKKPFLRIPRFEDIAFDLKGDLHGLEIDTR